MHGCRNDPPQLARRNDLPRFGIGGFTCMVLGALVGCQSSEAPILLPTAIVFDWSRNGSRSIYRAALDGTDTLRLTSVAADDEHPSERAGMVVFTSYRDGNAELYAVAGTGGAAHRLTTTAANETQPALSPDGTKIAYVSDASGVTKLWISAADGTGAQPLTTGFGFSGSVEASPSWAPDGTRLVFVSTTNGSADLYILTFGGGTPSPLVTDPGADVEPAWSPDGKLVAFASERAGGGSTNIFTVDVATHHIAQLTNDTGTDGQAAWLPDGRLVYTAWVAGTARLRWLDPAAPGSATDAGPSAGDVQHAAAVF